MEVVVAAAAAAATATMAVLASFIVSQQSEARNWNEWMKKAKQQQQQLGTLTQIMHRKIFIHHISCDGIYGSMCGKYNFQRETIFRYTK